MSDSIAHEWTQRTSQMSRLAREKKFRIYKQSCIILFIMKNSSPLLTSLMNENKRIDNPWIKKRKPHATRSCSSRLEFKFFTQIWNKGLPNCNGWWHSQKPRRLRSRFIALWKVCIICTIFKLKRAFFRSFTQLTRQTICITSITIETTSKDRSEHTQ